MHKPEIKCVFDTYETMNILVDGKEIDGGWFNAEDNLEFCIANVFEMGLLFARTSKGAEILDRIEEAAKKAREISKRPTNQEHIWDSLKDDLKEAGL